MKRYVIGFMFDYNIQNVVLIEKNRPAWQAGRLNGVGGHIEKYEKPIDAMIREFYEETNTKTMKEDWKHVLTLRFKYKTIELFASNSITYYEYATTWTDERICKVSIKDIIDKKYNCISNIPALINLSILRLIDVKESSE